MKLFKLLLLLIALNMSVFAETGLTLDEENLKQKFISYISCKHKKSIGDFSRKSLETQKLMLSTFKDVLPWLEKKDRLDQEDFVFRLNSAISAYEFKQSNTSMVERVLPLTLGSPDLPPKVGDRLLALAKEKDTASGVDYSKIDQKAVLERAKKRIDYTCDANGRQVAFKEYTDGKLIKQSIKKQDGSSETYSYYPNGNKQSVFPLKDASINGWWKHWYENGQLKDEAFYVDWSKEGKSKEYFENGKLKSEVEYTNDKPHGKYILYYDNGQKYREIDFVNGNKNGKFMEWRKDGGLARDISYRNDKLHGTFRVYDSNGKLQKEGEYVDGISKYYREYQTTGAVGAIKLEENRINDKTVEFKEYSFQADSKDKQYIKKTWTEINDKKEGVLSEYWYWDFKDQRIIRSETIYKNGIAQKYTDFTAEGIDIAEVQTFNEDKNITSVIEYDKYNSDKNERKKVTLKYSFKGEPRSYGNKVGVLTRYSLDGKVILEETYDESGNVVKTKNFLNSNLEKIVNDYAKNRSYGIGYYWLDIEKQFGNKTDNSIKVLDEIINDVKKRVVLKSNYSKADALEILNTIGSVIKSKSITYDYNHESRFGHTLENRAMDCHIISTLYVTIADKLNLPIYMVEWPQHISVKWESKNVNIFWEATVHKDLPLDEYKRWRLAPWQAEHGLDNGGYGKPLDSKKLMGHVVFWAGQNSYPSTEFFKMAAKLYPTIEYGLKSFMPNDSWENAEKSRNTIFGENDLYNKKRLGELYSYGVDRNDKKVIYYYKDCRNFPSFIGIEGRFGSYMCMSSLAQAYANLGKYDEAISTYEQMQIDHSDQRENLSKKIGELKKKVGK